MNNPVLIVALSFCLLISCAERSDTANTTNSISPPGFKAEGKTPSWEITVDFDGHLSFRSHGDHAVELTANLPKPIRPQDTHSVSYRAQAEEGQLHMTIFRRPCTDSATSPQLDYNVRINIQPEGMSDTVRYEGCGKYLGDYRLNDIWVLKTINGQLPDSSKKAPTLEFQLEKNKVLGFSGCNSINGNFEMTQDSLSFGDIAATQKTCTEMEVEQTLLDKISGKSFYFDIHNLQLTLSNDQSTLTFKKVD